MPEELAAPLRNALADLSRWLDALGIPAMIIGGIAASVLGRPRLTRDIDALVIMPESGWAAAVRSTAQFGIEPRIDDPAVDPGVRHGGEHAGFA